MTDADQILARARMFKFVREVGANGGRWVEAIQRIGGTSKGQPWCACFVSMVLGIWYDGKPPLPFTASCDVLLETAKAKGCLVTVPAPGDVFLHLKSVVDATHTGFVTAVRAKEFDTIEGNTNPEGGADGYGVFERDGPHARKRGKDYAFIRYLP